MIFVAPPSLTQPPPPAPAVERDLTFPGHTGHPLKGTVLAGGDHPFFAVFVAGTGPMDRNWSSPQLPRGRTGEELARWFRSQGIGSLRYDKRYIGSRNAKLDVSLDAQGGDVKAALAAARALPEAKGKRILLVAHSEAVLVSLVAAPEADAVLALAMPPKPMGKALVEQLSSQLPESMRKDNLTYVEAVLNAIRWDQPLPSARPEVHPGVVRMAQGLMAAETLAFVKGTLDLDPWAVLGRLPVPVAVAWGDRDVQNPRPAFTPPTFKGTVLDLPEANHLLRRETRVKADLDPARARLTYGEDTPLADLSPLAAWLKTLGR